MAANIRVVATEFTDRVFNVAPTEKKKVIALA